MAEVVFCCPKTGTEFESGFQALPHDLQVIPRDAQINLQCRVCGERHHFKFSEARTIESRQGIAS